MDTVRDPGEEKEIEYKFLLAEPEAGSAVIDSLKSNGYRLSQLRILHQQDLYLDTFDWRLYRHGLSLRLRTIDHTTLYTLKGLGKVKDGRAERREVEVEVEEAVKDPSEVSVKRIREEIDGIIHPRRLIGQLIVRTQRQPYRVQCPDGTVVELAFDTTNFSARGLNRPRRAQRLYELEAELKKGPEAGLEALGGLLTGLTGLTPSRHSKLETAIERLGILFPARSAPEDLRVKLEDRLDRALQKILSFQLLRLLENVPGVLADIDTEFVHQARVATRRMRSAIRLFREAVPERIAQDLAGELSWIGALFGAVRDLDVFLLNLPGVFGAIEKAPERSTRTLAQHIRQRRTALLDQLREGLGSSRYKRFCSRLRAFIERPAAKNPSAPLALASVHAFASSKIPEHFHAVLTRGRKVLEKPKLKNFHRLRIEFKRLRYACEFFTTAYGDALRGFIDETVKVQDCLGEMQDTVFVRTLIDGLLSEWKGSVLDPRLLFMLGEIYELQGGIARKKEAEFQHIWNYFDQDATRAALAAALKRT